LAFVLIFTLWVGATGHPNQYRIEMKSEADCKAMIAVLENWPKVRSPDIHAVCVTKNLE
jgi:hypothetical protein